MKGTIPNENPERRPAAEITDSSPPFSTESLELPTPFCYDVGQGDQVMNTNYTAVIKQDADWWIGWIEEVPGVNCQESSREELLKSLRETLTEAIELNRADALESVGDDFEELSIAV